MTERMPAPDRLAHLLNQAQQHPHWATLYPARTQSSMTRRVQDLAQQVAPLLRTVLVQGMVDASASQVDDLVRRITPRVVLVCALLAVEEPLAPPLHQVALVLAVLYWADDCLDRGDLAMAQALQVWVGGTTCPPTDPPVQARLRVVAALDQYLTPIAPPRDVTALATLGIHPFLTHAYALHRLRPQAIRMGPMRFWQQHTATVVHHAVESIQLPGTLLLLYALYQRRHPDLSTVADLMADPQLLPLLATLGNMVLRVCDDAGDYDQDRQAGTLNLFTHPAPRAVVAALGSAAGLPWDRGQAAVVRVWQQGTPASRRQVVTQLTAVLQVRVAAVAPQIPPSAHWFLTLTRRMLLLSALVATGDI